MSDRLISYISGVSGKSLSLTTPFAQIIKKWEKTAGSVAWGAYKDLPSAVDAWRKKRNDVVHGFVKSNPGTPTECVDSVLDRAKDAAVEGCSLARAVCAWHKQQLAAAKRGNVKV